MMKQHKDFQQKRNPWLRVYISLFIGIVIKTVFILIAWFMVTSETIFSPFNPFSLIYFTLALVLGSLLSGLVVGFLAREPRRGALLSFLGAILATIFVSTPLSIRLFPLGILLFGESLMFDIMALVGGAIGASIGSKSLKLAVLVVLVAFTLVPVHAFISAPTTHIGDLIIGDNQVFSIENSVYYQAGSIIVKDNATFIIRNAKLIIDQRQEEHQITIKDMAHMVAENSRFTVITRNRVQRARATSWIYVENFASLLLNKSSSPAIEIIARQASDITITNSKWSHPISTYDQSQMNAIDSSLYILNSHDSSDIRCCNSSSAWITCYDDSEILIVNTRRIADIVHTYGYVHCHNHSFVEIRSSTIDGLFAHAFQNTVCFNNTVLDEKISIDSLSSLYIYGNVTVNGQIDEFEGKLVRNYLVLTNPDILLNVTNKESGTILWTGKSSNFGSARFNMTFTFENYTQNLQLNNRDFNMTSSTPLKVGL
ncbi:hypothetical protein GTO27_04075 [Candidatus Bathyarchaeota archaeon]|nr:hypothetical protein [Candidatus Bathyarchaeota archaeon]